ncbi:MAG: FHA domain-containing protein [Deltaproteobacteria bacterium]|nr:FHA domain-containing protein [Deltaproteobacteria bacterium]
MRKLYIIKGQDEGKSFELDGERILFGRSQKNDIQIIDKFVSGRHLEIVCGAHKYTITDLHSSNGTFVDGKQITPRDRI